MQRENLNTNIDTYSEGRSLLEMRQELAVILAQDPALKQAVMEVSKMDMMKASLAARNPKHQNIKIDRILDGELQRDLPVGDCLFIQNIRELAKAAYNYLDMGYSVDRNLLVAAYRILSENPEATTRTDNPVVLAFSHVPPEHEEIEDRLALSFRKIYRGELESDLTGRAMYMHNSIIDIWPFDEFSGEIAIFAMNYYLLEMGLMPIDMPIDRKDYLEMVSSALKGRRMDEEYVFFRNAIEEKMAGTIEVCRGYLK